MTELDEIAASPAARKRHALELFASLPSEYDWMGALLSFGQDRRWRRATVSAIKAGPTDRILDVATGTGLVAAELVRHYGCSVIGIDQSEEMLSRARERVASEPRLAGRVQLLRGEAERLPFADGEFDGLTFGYLLRYVDDPAVTIRELARVVKPGGRIASYEFFVPQRRVARALWSVYTRYVMPAAGRLASRSWFDVSRFLSFSIPAFYEGYPLSLQCQAWRDAGISLPDVRVMSFGAGVVMSGTREDSG
jgi:demethylmenaquinone methyltransferase/2-methoxy-6-polyprenyl-1,4-benzoquinol methylase